MDTAATKSDANVFYLVLLGPTQNNFTAIIAVPSDNVLVVVLTCLAQQESSCNW